MASSRASAVQRWRAEGREIVALSGDPRGHSTPHRFRRPGGRRLTLARIAGALVAFALMWCGLVPAGAVEAINVRLESAAIDLTAAVERHPASARILVSTAPGPDGIVQRMDVRAREGNN